MTTENRKDDALVPAQSAVISHTRSGLLASRGLADVRANEQGYLAHWSTGREFLKVNRFQEAIACFERASLMNPEQADNQWRFTFLLDEWHAGPPRQDIESVRWYRLGADRGIACTQNRLGDAYFTGTGVSQDHVQAAFWYRKAADQGWADSQYALGWMFHSGTGVRQDWQEAARWYREAATQGTETAQVALGDLYKTGYGVPKDLEQAAYWYRQAQSRYANLAEQGGAPAQFCLGQMYEKGQGFAKDDEEAKGWYSKAAEQGHGLAMAALARMRSADQ